MNPGRQSKRGVQVKVLRPDAFPETDDPIGAYFRFVSSRKERMLLLDFDGTLAPFTEDRHATRPYPGIPERLKRLAALSGNRLVIISGRSIADLKQLLPLEPRPEFWGSHGWERLTPGATEIVMSPMPTAMRDGLERARAWTGDQNLEDWIESKPSSIALHWRGRPGHQMTSVREKAQTAWASLGKSAGLEIHSFDGGLELRAPGHDKGTVVRSLLSESPAASAVAFLGDDLTDEDAFRMLEGRGLRVLVRGEFRPTEADLWIQPPEELLDFLDRWAEACLPHV
jgi:trehalose-phosphatase